MKIYDCFTFFNELDLLEIRLSELYDYVDYFVLVEARKTHNNKEKELYYEKNKNRYKKYADKIIHIVVDFPNFNWFDKFLIFFEDKITHGKLRVVSSTLERGRWLGEVLQRKAIIKGLGKCDSEDIIMVSDLDEIPNPFQFKLMKKKLNNANKITFRQKMYKYFLNLEKDGFWYGTKAIRYSYLIKKYKGNIQRIRLRRFHFIKNILGFHEKMNVIKNGGWHFTFIGDSEMKKLKKDSIAESSIWLNKDILNLKKIKKGIYKDPLKGNFLKIVKIDKSFPKQLIKNKKQLIKRGYFLQD